jgi:bacteriocin biosynthesis cyclodehydratase domain-containing protein
MYAANLVLIRISEDQVVLKRGVHELLFEGSGIAGIAERVVLLASRTGSLQEIIGAFPGPQRSIVEKLLDELVRRRMLGPPADEPESVAGDPQQEAFYWNFGQAAARAPARLAAARILVIGVNSISRALVEGLVELGFGQVTLVHHPVLDNRQGSLEESSAIEPATSDTLPWLSELPSPQDWAEYSLICATSDLGEADALLDINRRALATRRPYLPAWFSNLVGFVGPLNVPFETPCLSCFRLRRDANDRRFEVSRAVRGQFTAAAAKVAGTGLLPPMPRILGSVAALEIAKYVGGFAPADTVSRLIELNLVSFQGAVRRLLKVPRCPECSDLTFRNSKAITVGPQIPVEAGPEPRP